jgi:putative copper resistance protein D
LRRWLWLAMQRPGPSSKVVQESADVLHLLAAASWVGSLVPLALLLGTAVSERSESLLAVARMATLRFSTLGIASVATVLGSGIINTWELAGSVRALGRPSLGKSRAVPRHGVARCGQSAEP